MEHFGIEIAEGTDITNLTIPSGTSFPVNDNVGELFYRTDLDTMYVRNNTEWEISGSSTSNNRNVIINGDFDIWQRDTSQTSSGFGSDDRWRNSHVGSTKTHSRGTFSVGQTEVPSNPTYFSRTVVTSVAGSSNFVYKYIKIENVSTFAGETITVSFWARADASKNIATELGQHFGSGGAPSSIISEIGVTTHSLTTTWQKFTVTLALPSISGKTLGTDNNDNLQLVFWFEAGSDHNNNTNSLGQQSGTFDIAQVQVEGGGVATNFEQRSVGEELRLCQRYYEETTFQFMTSANAALSGTLGGNVSHMMKRAIPTIIELSSNQFENVIVQSITPAVNHVIYVCQTTNTNRSRLGSTISIDAEL